MRSHITKVQDLSVDFEPFAWPFARPETCRQRGHIRCISTLWVQTADQPPLFILDLEREGFYVPGVEEIRSGRLKTLGITHPETIARADLMLAGNSTFEQMQFQRRRAIEVPSRGTLYLAAPEDLILNKLRWGSQSQSEKQWRDVLGILKMQGENLDFDYLTQMANTLDLSNPLSQALTEARL